MPFFSMEYSHLQKCLRATQAQCPSFIAKNACQKFWSKAPHHGATSFYQIIHICLHFGLPSPTQPPAAYLDSLNQNKSTVPPHTTVSPAPCSLPPRFCMELLSILQSRCSSVSHCLTEERVVAHRLLHGNSPWMCLNIVQYTLRPLACLGNSLFTSHIPSHSTAWVLLVEHLLCDLSDEI